MAESFTNATNRAVGIITSYSGSTVAAGSTEITVTANTGIGVSDLVDNTNFLAGTKVKQIDGTTIYTDRNSTNDAAATNQIIKFLGVTTSYISAAGVKSILIGGTFANNTENSINVTVGVLDASSNREVAIASKIPVPNGSSFVITDAGKTLLESLDEVRVYCDVDGGIDVNLSILTGVN